MAEIWFPRPRITSKIGRLDDGTEVEYTELLGDFEVSKYPDAVFLGVGEYVREGREVPRLHTVEDVEIALLKSRFLTDEMKRDTKLIAGVAEFIYYGVPRRG
jgi:aspartate/tyrosine/aromatic aminotransferase